MLWGSLSTWAWVVLWLSALSPVLAIQPKPPRPNPDHPVNYIEWINATVGGQVKDNAYDAYQTALAELKPSQEHVDFGATLSLATKPSPPRGRPCVHWCDSRRGRTLIDTGSGVKKTGMVPAR